MVTEDGLYIHSTILLRNKDEIMPFPVTGKKPEILTLSEVSETGRRGIIGDYFWWNLKMDANEYHYKRETASQT